MPLWKYEISPNFLNLLQYFVGWQTLVSCNLRAQNNQKGITALMPFCFVTDDITFMSHDQPSQVLASRIMKQFWESSSADLLFYLVTIFHLFRKTPLFKVFHFVIPTTKTSRQVQPTVHLYRCPIIYPYKIYPYNFREESGVCESRTSFCVRANFTSSLKLNER